MLIDAEMIISIFVLIISFIKQENSKDKQWNIKQNI